MKRKGIGVQFKKVLSKGDTVTLTDFKTIYNSCLFDEEGNPVPHSISNNSLTITGEIKNQVVWGFIIVPYSKRLFKNY